MPSSETNFESFLLPDISNADYTKITKFSKEAPSWRTIGRGLNLEGICKNKECIAYKEYVWSNFRFGTFHMSETIHKCKCPQCGKYTSGNKRIGVYKMELTGRGMKSSNSVNGDDTDCEDFDREIQFKKIIHDSSEGILKFDGKNGKFVKWKYMTLTISRLN